MARTAGHRPLRPYQQTALQWAAPLSTAGFLLDMRLGKTLLAIRWALTRARARSFLVVSPPSVIPTWQRELGREGIPSMALRGGTFLKVAKLERSACQWHIINHEGLVIPSGKHRRLVPSPICMLPWDVVILDESPFIKNPMAKRTKAVLKFLGRARYRAILTGLVDPEGLLDVITQMLFLQQEFLGFKNYWSLRAALFFQAGFDWLPKRGVSKRIRGELRQRCFVLSRKEAGLGEKKVFERRYVELPPKLRKAYDQVEQEFAYGGNTTRFAVVARTWLFRLAAGFPHEKSLLSLHKVKEVLYLLTGPLKREPVLIWFRLNKAMLAVQQACKKAGLSVASIQGLTPVATRNRIHMGFQRGRTRVLLLQIKCVRYGLALGRSSTAIYFSEPDSQELWVQSQDRIVNVEKHEPLLYIEILTRGTLDEDISAALRQKRVSSKAFMQNVLQRLQARIRRRRDGYGANA